MGPTAGRDFQHTDVCVEGGRAAKEVCRGYGVSSATDYKWKPKYGGMEASDIVRLKEFEEENRRLKMNGENFLRQSRCTPT